MLSKSQIKYIQSLADKKGRIETKCFIAEGPKIMQEFLHIPDVYIQHIYALPQWINQYNILLEKKEIKVETITEEELKKISQIQTPNQVLAVVKQFDVPEQPILNNGLYLMLDGIQDPGNMGTIIRTADWFGISGIICSEDCVDMYNSKVVQSSMASIANVKIWYENLISILKTKKDLNVYGALLNGRDIRTAKLEKNAIIIIGNESKGIRENLLPYITENIAISKFGKAESLNAAVAAGIILSFFRQKS